MKLIKNREGRAWVVFVISTPVILNGGHIYAETMVYTKYIKTSRAGAGSECASERRHFKLCRRPMAPSDRRRLWGGRDKLKSNVENSVSRFILFTQCSSVVKIGVRLVYAWRGGRGR